MGAGYKTTSIIGDGNMSGDICQSCNKLPIIFTRQDYVTIQGFTITNRYTGILMTQSSFCTIQENKFIDTSAGLFIEPLFWNNDGSYSLIQNNIFQDNILGVRIFQLGGGTGCHNTFINNNFIDNYPNPEWYWQCFDGGTNYWNYNYWNDYTEYGYDNDGDGIGDIPSLGPGGCGSNRDYYPLMNPAVAE